MILRSLSSARPRAIFRPRVRWFVGFAAAPLVLAGAPAVGQSAPIPPSPPAQTAGIVGRLPGDLELVVRIQDAQRQLQSCPGQSLLRALAGAQLFAETGAAWVNLAEQLGWTPEEALRHLAGQRLILAIAGATPEGDRAWAILSDVSDVAERRLLDRLHAAPRQTIAGQPVLALENGRFELAVFCPPEHGPSNGAPSCTVVLAPTQQGDLLDRIVRGLTGKPPGPTLAESPAMREAEPLLGGDIFILAMRSSPTGPQHVMLSATLVDDGWNASLRASPSLLLGDDPPDGPYPLWSAQAVADLAPEAVALVMSDGLLGLDHWAPLFLVPTLPEAAERLHGLLGRRTFLGLFRAPRDDDQAPGIAMVLGLETPDAAALAGPGDAVIARLVGAVEAGANARDADRPDFEGYLPNVPRAVRLTGPVSALWRPVLGPSPILTWLYRSGPQDQPPVDVAVPRPGWWFMALAPSDQRRPAPGWASGVCERLARPGADPRPRVSVGAVRVAELARWFDDIHLDPKGSLSPLRGIEEVRWDTWIAPDGRVEGDVRITTTPPEAYRRRRARPAPASPSSPAVPGAGTTSYHT